MEISKQVDWLSITFQTGTQMAQVFPTLDWHHVGRGMHGYQSMYRDALTGAIYMEASNNDDMGVHLQLSGDALAALRSERGGTDDGLIRLLADRHGYVSRIDLALDIHQGRITPLSLNRALREGKAHAKSDRYRLVQGVQNKIEGDTLYIGSPKSDRQLRCYDKAAELGIQNGEAWVRLELECRRLTANAAFQSCAHNGVSSVVTGHLGDFLSWDSREYEQALSGVSVEPYDIPRKDSRRRRWLLGQVVQALAKEIHEDVRFPELFAVAVKEELAKLDRQR